MSDSVISDGRSADSEVTRKRSRPVLSCLECRRKKLKCDRHLPCQQCCKSGRADACIFNEGIEPLGRTNEQLISVNGGDEAEGNNRAKRARLPEPSHAYRNISTVDELRGVSQINETEAPGLGRGLIEDLQVRVARLERTLAFTGNENIYSSKINNPSSDNSLAVTSSRSKPSLDFAMKYHARKDRLTFLTPFPEAMTFANRIQLKQSNVADLAEDLHTLHDVLKRRSKPRTTSQNQSETLTIMLSFLPSRVACRKLVDLYFENFENCHRVLHKPSFDGECEELWIAYEQGSSRLTATLPTLLVVISIASSIGTIPECEEVHLERNESRPSVRQAVQSWIDSLPRKTKFSLEILRIKLLMLLPQRSRSETIEDMWLKTGDLVRHAIIAGLHRDLTTSPDEGTFEMEMRSRLWASILELDLSISIMAGAPGASLPENFIVNAPANVNDIDLVQGMKTKPVARPSSEWTDSLCQYILASSLPMRLTAYRYATGGSGGINYEDTLNWTRLLERALQDLPPPLKFDFAPDHANSEPGRLFARIVLDTLIRRLLLNLYTPFALMIFPSDAFKEARTCYVQSSLIILCYQDLFDPKFCDLNVQFPEGYWDMFYRIYRYDILQTTLGLCLEIKRLTEGGTPFTRLEGVASTSLHEAPMFRNKIAPWTKATLIKTVDDSIEPMIRRISRSGADIKDLLLITIAFYAARNANRPSDQREAAIKEGVRELIAASQRQMQKDGLLTPSLGTTPSASSSDGLFSGEPILFPDLWNPTMGFGLNIPTFPFPNIGEDAGGLTYGWQ